MRGNLARFITVGLVVMLSGGAVGGIIRGKGPAKDGFVYAAPLDGDKVGLEGGINSQKLDNYKEASALVLHIRQEHQRQHQHHQGEMNPLLSKRALSPQAARRALELFVLYFLPAFLMTQMSIYDDEDWEGTIEDEKQKQQQEQE